jgi:hypothetical protein
MSLVEVNCRSQPDTPFLSKDSALTAFGFLLFTSISTSYLWQQRDSPLFNGNLSTL